MLTGPKPCTPFIYSWIIPSLVPADGDRPTHSGQGQGLGLFLDRLSCGSAEASPGRDGHSGVGASPCALDLAVDQQTTGPDARWPELAAAGGAWNQELAIAPVEEQERVAAREETCGRRRRQYRAKRRLVGDEDPCIADRGFDRRQRLLEVIERGGRVTRNDTRPPAKCLGRRRSVDVQEAARQLEARFLRIHRRRRYGPDDRPPRSLPPDQDSAGR